MQHPRRGTLREMRTAYIALGSNLASQAGPPEVTLAAAASKLESLGRLASRSSLYSTAPIGFGDQPRFLNAVIALETDLAPAALLEKLLSIEKDFGRNRADSIPNGPRTLDLDILLLGDLQVSEPGLEIPHPRLAERSFVLVPLAEIAPEIVVASHGKTVAQLLQTLLNNCEGETDAVVRVQSNAWRSGASRDADDSDDSLRAAPHAPDTDRRR
jgi:2-amino-4-hydroxy-6-hydroxymethyldihydropteridine diphosphokinase